MIGSKWMIACLGFALAGIASGKEDAGKEKIGLVSVTVYYATHGDAKAAGEKTAAVPQKTAERLRKEEKLRFKTYRMLGQDTQALLRSYESWAQPLKPSDEVMVRFEAQGKPTQQTAVLDLELWLGRNKTVKTDARLEVDLPLYVLGPEWRGGRLIIAVALVQERKSGK
jgi:hypothetical protein